MLCIGESGYFRYNQNLTEENVCNQNEMTNLEINSKNSETESRNQQDMLDNNNAVVKSKTTINSNDSSKNWGKGLRIYSFSHSLEQYQQ